MRKEVGKGRVAYFPQIEFDGPLPPAAPYFQIGVEFWKRPKNWEELIEAVRWVSQGNTPLQVRGRSFWWSTLRHSRASGGESFIS